MEIYGARVGERDIEKSLMFFMEGFGETTTISYYFWCIRDGNETILIDTGFTPEAANERGVRRYRSPDLLLREINVKPEEVNTVLLTHLHWDHFGGESYFPNAKFYVQEKEWQFATGTFSHTRVVRQFYNYKLIEKASEMLKLGRLQLIGDAYVLENKDIAFLPMGGHTPGSQVIMVSMKGEPIVFCGDLSYFYRNILEDNPPMLNLDIPECLEAYRKLRMMSKSDQAILIPGHDPVLLERYKKVSDYIIQIR